MQVPARYAGSEQHCRRCGEPFVVPRPLDAETPDTDLAVRRRAWLWPLIVLAAIAAVVAAMVVTERLLEGPPSASELVTQTMGPNVIATRVVEGPLGEGTAVLVNDVAAYWVRGGTVYGCNPNALAWSPGIALAPAGCDLFAVERAVLRH
jgi:hypothetical protein